MKIVAIKINNEWFRADVFRWDVIVLYPKFGIEKMRPKTHAWLILKYSGWYDYDPVKKKYKLKGKYPPNIGIMAEKCVEDILSQEKS